MTRKVRFLIMAKSLLSFDENGNLIKFCKKCETHKSGEEFYQNVITRKDGTERINYSTHCKECHKYALVDDDQKKRQNERRNERRRINGREPRTEKEWRNRWYKKNYRITIKDYETLWNNQKGVCAICQQPETAIHHQTGKVKRLAVDHCHKTGEVRGLLCARCNFLIGAIRDDAAYIRSISGPLIDYLEKN